eukprot:TRINITY_DN14006_c0_g1_i1.p1 TRINITY_DN14006_c0_g1~~TRINITY_DN14006_c0_g1_i1.p1  ORF type:complete len:449 (+),score=33.00 TRINITY_DN14006_c0_g1_i1:52-1398(+)
MSFDSLSQYLARTHPPMLHIMDEMKKASGAGEADLINGLDAVYRTRNVTFKKRLEYFYNTYCKHKVHNAEWLAVKYKHKKEALMSALVYQYGPEPRIPQRELPFREAFSSFCNRTSCLLLVRYFRLWRARASSPRANRRSWEEIRAYQTDLDHSMREALQLLPKDPQITDHVERRSWEEISQSQQPNVVAHEKRSWEEIAKSQRGPGIISITARVHNKNYPYTPDTVSRVPVTDVAQEMRSQCGPFREAKPSEGVPIRAFGHDLKYTSPLRRKKVPLQPTFFGGCITAVPSSGTSVTGGCKAVSETSSETLFSRESHGTDVSGVENINPNTRDFVNRNHSTPVRKVSSVSAGSTLAGGQENERAYQRNYDMLSMPVTKPVRTTTPRGPTSPVCGEEERLQHFVTNLLDSLPDYRHPSDSVSTLSLSPDCEPSPHNHYHNTYCVPNLHF